MLNLDTSGVNSADELGTTFCLPGRYHTVVKAVDESFSKFPEAVIVEFEILAGTVPGQEKKTHREFFSTKGKAIDRIKRFAMVTGLIGPNERKQVNLSDALGHQLVIEIIDEEYQGKTRSKVSYVGMWSPDHKEVADVPKDKAFLALHGQGKVPVLRSAPQPAAQQPASQPVTAAAGADPYGDL